MHYGLFKCTIIFLKEIIQLSYPDKLYIADLTFYCHSVETLDTAIDDPCNRRTNTGVAGKMACCV